MSTHTHTARTHAHRTQTIQHMFKEPQASIQ